MTILELETKQKQRPLSYAETIILKAKKRLEDGKKRGIIYLNENSTVKTKIKMDF